LKNNQHKFQKKITRGDKKKYNIPRIYTTVL